jgi:hypothetical protein
MPAFAWRDCGKPRISRILGVPYEIRTGHLPTSYHLRHFSRWTAGIETRSERSRRVVYDNMASTAGHPWPTVGVINTSELLNPDQTCWMRWYCLTEQLANTCSARFFVKFLWSRYCVYYCVLQGAGIPQSAQRRATGWTTWVRFPAGPRDFSLFHGVHTGPGTHRIPYPMGAESQALGEWSSPLHPVPSYGVVLK